MCLLKDATWTNLMAMDQALLETFSHAHIMDMTFVNIIMMSKGAGPV
jgi:hypothetical protein